MSLYSPSTNLVKVLFSSFSFWIQTCYTLFLNINHLSAGTMFIFHFVLLPAFLGTE